MTFTTPPPDFAPKFDIVGCYVGYDGKVIALKRQLHKPQGGQYGLPAGKVDAGENLVEAMSRELREETGISIPADKLILIKSFPTRYPEYDFIFHAFKVYLPQKLEVKINEEEHIHYRWMIPEKVLTLPGAMDGFADYTKALYSF